MKILIIGNGIQGKKRILNLNKKIKYKVFDPYLKSDYQKFELINLDNFDAVFLCIPDVYKFYYIELFLKKKIPVLVEKPLFFDDDQLNYLYKLSKKNKTVCYTAYNHRFEPSFLLLKKKLEDTNYTNLYNCKMFYGNGTASLIKNSPWKDKKTYGVLSDIGSHLIDLSLFWFGKNIVDLKLINLNKFENKSPDFANFIIYYKNGFYVECKMTYCMWKNDFTLDLFSKNYTCHINTLVKWGISNFQTRKRIYPSGLPKIKNKYFNGIDPTWKLEHRYFFNLIKKSNDFSNLRKDILINKYMKNLTNQIND